MTNNFPFNRALALWRSDCDRRGEYNTTNSSSELDMEDNILEAHNNSSCTKFHVHNIENEGRHVDVNWDINIPQDVI
jgi:hypothetical protein